MKIGSSTYSLGAQNQLLKTTRLMARALERLSSGRRINSARDDSAGLGIANRLESQVRGLSAGILNLNQSRGFLLTAEGALENQIEIVQRMKELALQASNGTLSSVDRSNLQKELNALIAEVDRIGQNISFNGENLLDGSFGERSIQVGSNKNESIQFSMVDSRASAVFTKSQTSGVPGGQGAPNGSFGSVNNLMPGNNLGRVLFDDFTSDGISELFYGDGNDFTILESNGQGSYGVIYSLNHSVDASLSVRADLDGDGTKDLVAYSNNFTTLYSMLATNPINYSPATVIDSALQTVLDVQRVNSDGDQFDDLIVLDGTDNWALYYGNTGGGVGGTTKVYAISGNVLSMAVGDINNDGLDEVIVADDNYGFRVGTDLRNGASVDYDYAANSSFSKMQLIDWDGDHDLDLVGTGLNQIELWLNNGAGDFSQSEIVAVDTGSATSMDIADLNGNGKYDVILADKNDTSKVRVYYDVSSGSYGSTDEFDTGSDVVTQVKVEDINLDGALDLLAVTQSGGIHSFMGQFASTAGGVETNIVSAVDDLSILSQVSAQNSLEILESGLQYLIGNRVMIGTQLNRLDYAEANSQNAHLNLSASLSESRDVDFGSQTAELVRLQILQQAQTSVLSQAQISLRMVLELLKP